MAPAGTTGVSRSRRATPTTTEAPRDFAATDPRGTIQWRGCRGTRAEVDDVQHVCRSSGARHCRRGRGGRGRRSRTPSLPVGNGCMTSTRWCSISGEIRMANPFSAVPTPYRVRADDRGGTPTVRGMPSASARLSTRTDASRRRAPTAAIRSRSRSTTGDRTTTRSVFHCLVPAARWWDNIVFT